MSSARIDIIGNLGANADVQYGTDGTPRASFRLAVSQRPRQGQPEVTNWYRCTFWGARSEKVAPYMLKGKQIHVHGDFEPSIFTKNTGEAALSLDIRVSEVDLLGPVQQGEQGGQPKPKVEAGSFDDEDGGLPF